MKSDGLERSFVQFLDVRKSDVLVFNLREDIGPEEYARMEQIVRGQLGPDLRFLILTEGTTLTVLRPEPKVD